VELRGSHPLTRRGTDDRGETATAGAPPLPELLAKAGDGDFLRSVAEAVLQLLLEADVEGLIGAGRYERTGERLNCRNGFRDRTLDTRLGAPQLRVPKLRQGSSFPPFLEPRNTRRANC
jgi:putative transposase